MNEYPVTFAVDYPERNLDRLTSFFRIITVIPIAILLAGTGTALLWPTSMWINFAGLAIFLAIFAHNIWQDRRATRVAAHA